MSDIWIGGGVLRWDSTELLANLARRHLQLFRNEIVDLDRLRAIGSANDDEREASNQLARTQQRQALSEGLIAVVFSAFALEAHINEYGSRRLGRSLFERLDKLDTVSKWILVPRLVCGKELPKDRAPYQFLCELFRWRNEIAHPKAKDANLNDPDLGSEIMRRDKKEDDFIAFVSNMGKAGDELTAEARELDREDPLFGHIQLGLEPVQVSRNG
jgi:hypothetical protein